MKLNPNETSAMFHGCEFDYTSNTYRLHITLSAGSVTIAENFMVIKVDGATGFPKICSIRYFPPQWSLVGTFLRLAFN